ncbi:MAG TPA: hypothetical protein PKV98_16315 [Burkholderiaceae bacterium]|nr:hypothetical protein [Burkholderiaceae bacterium]
MSLERKDIRAKLDPEWHAALAVVAEADGKDMGEWVEGIVVSELKRRVDEATVIASAVARLGISGKSSEGSGAPR